MSKRYKSKTFRAIHETAEDLYGVGAISAGAMRRFDRSCLTKKEIAERARKK